MAGSRGLEIPGGRATKAGLRALWGQGWQGSEVQAHPTKEEEGEEEEEEGKRKKKKRERGKGKGERGKRWFTFYIYTIPYHTILYYTIPCHAYT